MFKALREIFIKCSARLKQEFIELYFFIKFCVSLNSSLERLFFLKTFSKYNSINSCFKRAEHFINISYNALNIFNPSKEKTILQNLTSYSLERSF